jgi:hypothetical protein
MRNEMTRARARAENAKKEKLKAEKRELIELRIQQDGIKPRKFVPDDAQRSGKKRHPSIKYPMD